MADMPYAFYALISVSVFAIFHLLGEKAKKLDSITHGRLLSFGGGVAISYVFIELLPKLASADFLVKKALEGVFPYFERHVYLMALFGFLLFFVVDRSQSALKRKESFWLSLFSYSLFNFLVGYAVVDKNDPDVQPLILFTFAMGLHFLMNDFSMNIAHKTEYEHVGRFLLIAALFLGWVTGVYITLSQTAISLVVAFIAGGVIMNVTRHELPKQNPKTIGAFLLGAVLYTSLLLAI